MNSKELYSIREWAPLTNIIERIPEYFRNGLFPTPLNITCVDAVAEYLALGSDAGVIFWVNRHTNEVQKLKAEVTSRITCVKIVDSVEFGIAAGDSSGQVNVFQIQKEPPPDLNLVAPCTRPKPIERYTIRDLHKSSVSCCEWSKNGMKLYSGDRQGVVVLTEFDYQMHLCKSIEILSETYEVVQLSVHQSHLLVCTLYRAIVCKCDAATKKWQIIQVGKQDRKQLVDCGGIFFKRSTKQPTLICGRPGLRFWIADTEGTVEKTLLFREAVARSPTWEIPILNPKPMIKSLTNLGHKTYHPIDNFRNLKLYGAEETLLITHDDAALYILNLERLCVEAIARGFRKILDFCVTEHEIFVLEGERSLLRLAPLPEKPNKAAKIIFNPLLPPPVPLLGAITNSKFESPVEYEPDEEAIINAEECFELPPIEKMDLNIPIELAVESPRAEQNRRLEIFNQISEMDFDQSILHHSGLLSGRKKRKSQDQQKAFKSEGIVEIAKMAFIHNEKVNKDEGNENIAKESNVVNSVMKTAELTTKPILMDASFCQFPVSNDMPEMTSTDTDFTPHLPDILSPTTLKKQIVEKAKSLAEELDLPEVHLAPITAEELRQSQELAAPPIPHYAQSVADNKIKTMELSKIYPHSTQLEDAGVQTTPRKKIYYIENAGDYSAGQPVDDICNTLRATTLMEDFVHEIPETSSPNNGASAAARSANALRFVKTQPLCEEISSFLLDFRRANDPIRNRQSPPHSAESNTSSDWEFLDN